MKQLHFLISTLFLVTTTFLQNGFAQDYANYKTLTGHTKHVYFVLFSPNGKTLASGSVDKTVHLWDVASGKTRRTLTGHTGSVLSLSFSPDGQTLASGSGDNTIRLWNVSSGEEIRELKGHTGSVLSMSFSPDGTTLASGSVDDTIRLWDVAGSGKIQTLTGHTDWIYSVSFSPDGTTIASGSRDTTIRLWDVSTGDPIRIFPGHMDSVRSVSFSPDGTTLTSGSGSWRNEDTTLRLWDVSTGDLIRSLSGHTDSVRSVSFSPDGQTLASGSGDSTIRLWDVKTGVHKRTFTGHRLDVISVSFSPDGQTLASGSGDKTVRLWKLTSPRNPRPTANEVYNNAIRAVMWIVNPGIGEGSGVLLDKKHKLAVTNAHVTGKQNSIDVYFPAPDEKGELIKDRNFYLTNGGVLKRLGYYTKGHVIAKNEKTDLAIIRLDGLPETAREIDWKLTPPTTKAGELVYILGNPAKQELWRWTLGEYLNDHGDFLHIQSDVFGGNSGGPVLNKQGILLGIVARSDQLMNAAAIPARHISRLLSKSKVKHSRMRR